MKPVNVLFVTWDGPQVAYLESLFLPIFERLGRRGMRFHVVQFTWADDARVARTRAACEAAGVPYRKQRVMRRPKAAGALASALLGGRAVARAVRDFRIDILMPRSHLPGLAVLASGMRHLPMTFDADGLPLDEAVEFAGRSPASPAHRFLRDVETRLVQRADVVLTRSPKAAEILLARAGAGTRDDKFHVVGNGRDAAVFHPRDAQSRSETRASLGVDPAAPLVVYAGSLGPQYCPAEMMAFMEAVLRRRADARWLVLSQQADALADALAARPALARATLLRAVPADAVASHLACADLGLALRRPSFSMQAVAPVKLGEYLMCGLPVLATAAVGDTSAIHQDVGRLAGTMDGAELESVAAWLLQSVMTDREGFRARCAAVGREAFSLEACVEAYAGALQGVADAR